MSLASLFNIPDDERTLDQFSFANADHHDVISAAILQRYNVDLPRYIIDPIPAGVARGVWLYNHQAMHNAQNEVLGINGNDLTDVDLSQPDQIAAWIDTHANEHLQAANILGTG